MTNTLADMLQHFAEFDAISLTEMDDVKLMNRADTKYIFNRKYLQPILTGLSAHYRILEIEGKRLSAYETRYFDTADHALYLLHQNGRKNRVKIRTRLYVESALRYLEVKFKNNKGKTIKERIKVTSNELNDARAAAFVKSQTGFSENMLIPALDIHFRRVTLVHKLRKERLTLDFGLTYLLGHEKMSYPELVIAELKQEKYNPNSEFVQNMKRCHLRQSNFSKYSVGCAIMYKGIKYNSFKKRILQLNKTIHE